MYIHLLCIANKYHCWQHFINHFVLLGFVFLNFFIIKCADTIIFSCGFYANSISAGIAGFTHGPQEICHNKAEGYSSAHVKSLLFMSVQIDYIHYARRDDNYLPDWNYCQGQSTETEILY